MGALDGIRVVDFGQWIAGPLTAMLLADQGADVVHVDPPGGPRWRTPANATLNRGKTPVVLDLRSADGLAEARRLIESADVVIENFRPGVMDRLGVGARATTDRSPRLISCSLPGFASDDPRAATPAWEGVVSAAAGVYAQGGDPRFTAVPISSTFGAIAAAVSIVMALIARERDGLGQRIEVPLFDATFLAIGSSGLLVNGKPEGGRPDDPWAGIFPCADGRWVRLSLATYRFVERFVAATGRADWIAKGYVQRERPGPLARGTELRERQQAELSALFRTRPALEWEDLGRRADVPLTLIRTTREWVETEHAATAEIVATVIDPELGAMRQPGVAVRLTGTAGAVRARPSVLPGHATAAAAGVPLSDATTEHAAHASLVWSSGPTASGVTPGESPGVRTDEATAGEPGIRTHDAAPGEPGFRTDDAATGASPDLRTSEVRAGHASAARLAASPGSGAQRVTVRLRSALDGIHVVDLTQVLAGPTATRTLAEFGADVVKVNNPSEEGAGYRWQVHRYHTDVNRGKRTVLVDLKTPGGLDVVHRLIDRADVVMQNFRLGVAERLGVGYEQVKARRPDIVYGSVSLAGYGGPWERVPGYEPNAQAATGMAARMADAAGTPGPQPFAPNDHATGLLGALGVGLALFHRLRHGEGQHVQTSLVAAATVLQATLIGNAAHAAGEHGTARYRNHEWSGANRSDVDRDDDGNEPGRSGNAGLGWSPLHRLYRASDGWFVVATDLSQRGRLAELDGFEDIGELQGTEFSTALEQRFAKRPVPEWVSVLGAAGIGAHALVPATSLMRDPWVVAHGLSLTRTDAAGDEITTIGPPFRLSRTPVVPGALVSPPGADAADVLASIGMADRLDVLVAHRAIALD